MLETNENEKWNENFASFFCGFLKQATTQFPGTRIYVTIMVTLTFVIMTRYESRSKLNFEDEKI